MNKQTVCADYARVFQTFMAMLGINCTFLTSSEHGWNMLELDGEYYNLDVCWDDVAYVNADTNSKVFFTSYKWFCIDDALKVGRDEASYEGPNPQHNREGLCTQLPTCEGQKYNYNTWYGEGEVDQVDPSQSNQENDSYSDDYSDDSYSDISYVDNYNDNNNSDEDEYYDECDKSYEYDPESIFPDRPGLNQLFKERDRDTIGENIIDYLCAAGYETSDFNLSFCVSIDGSFDLYDDENSLMLAIGRSRAIGDTLYCIAIDGKGFAVKDEGDGNIAIYYNESVIYMSVIDQGGY